MSYERAMRVLALSAILPAGATFYFLVFWRWFDMWRKHRIATYALMLGTFGLLGAPVYLLRRVVFAHVVVFPSWVRGVGWALVAIVSVFGFVADRQIGIRVRAFTPFFEDHGRIELKTTGAYGIVRHPIYAAGIGYQLGVFLVTGYLAVAVAWAVFALGALWFTRREEERLLELLDEPAAYLRYRERVPRLFPFARRAPGRAA
jgi:protein-S-isoprenylcysteine O-methyltransferase Ste14